MNEALKSFIEALRDELKHYGEMLALLDHEQELVMQRQTSAIPCCVAAINAEADTLHAVRYEREQQCRRLAVELNLAEEVPFKELLSHLPAEYQPLVEALVQENRELLVRVQQRARQNHLLLSRMVELMQKLISTIRPGNGPVTYNEGGSMFSHALPGQPLYEAVG